LKKSLNWNGSVCGKGNAKILRRLIGYAEKIFGLSEIILPAIHDRRRQPRIPTASLVKSALVLLWARLGSLNSWELSRPASFWKKWLGRPPASADSLGRVHALVEADGLRQGIRHVYLRLKRNKALPDQHGLAVAVLDGHESHASYRRHCSACLERTISSGGQERIQYYHRHVTLMLLPGSAPGRKPLRFLLDLEPQRPREDEVACALRLLTRVLERYERAFDLLLADALYAQVPFFHFLLARGKHTLVVLKDERRDLYQDSAGLFRQMAPQPGRYRSRQCSWWDVSDLRSWPEVNVPLRVVRSQETYSVQRQRDGKKEQVTTEWVWATTLPGTQVSTGCIVHFGHQRWDIENCGLNELVTHWHADHIYKHDGNAIECFLLETFLVFNIFYAFWLRNLKPQLRRKRTVKFCAELIAAELRKDVVPSLLPP
jgi:Transposase DDE domain